MRSLLLLLAASVAAAAAPPPELAPPAVTRERPKPPRAPASGAVVESMPDMDPPLNSIEVRTEWCTPMAHYTRIHD